MRLRFRGVLFLLDFLEVDILQEFFFLPLIFEFLVEIHNLLHFGAIVFSLSLLLELHALKLLLLGPFEANVVAEKVLRRVISLLIFRVHRLLLFLEFVESFFVEEGFDTKSRRHLFFSAELFDLDREASVHPPRNLPDDSQSTLVVVCVVGIKHVVDLLLSDFRFSLVRNQDKQGKLLFILGVFH